MYICMYVCQLRILLSGYEAKLNLSINFYFKPLISYFTNICQAGQKTRTPNQQIRNNAWLFISSTHLANSCGCQRNSTDFVPFHLLVMDGGRRGGRRGGRFQVPHILNLTYHAACLSYRISITVFGVGGYPFNLKKLETACRVKLYGTATWGWGEGLQPLQIATDGSVHVAHPLSPPPPAGHCARTKYCGN
jgi:hypothetical protein